MQAHRTSLGSIVAGLFLTLANFLNSFAAEVQVSTGIGGYSYACGWMAAQSTVSAAFTGYRIGTQNYTGVPEGTMVYTWNESSQQWDISTYEFGAWDVNSTLKTARGFLLRPPSGQNYIVYTLTFSRHAETAVNLTISNNKWYFLSRPWWSTTTISRR
jgi:hypothetical protein